MCLSSDILTQAEKQRIKEEEQEKEEIAERDRQEKQRIKEEQQEKEKIAERDRQLQEAKVSDVVDSSCKLTHYVLPIA